MIFKEIRKLAMDLGFSDIAFLKAEISKDDYVHYKNWINNNHNANMKYMENTDLRVDFDNIFPNAKTVILLILNYNYKRSKKSNTKIAKYAYGRDYHNFIRKRLKKIIGLLNEYGYDGRAAVDSAPILERHLFAKAGLGFIGKNSCLITKKYGSFVFLSEILTNLELKETDLGNTNQDYNFSVCGSCRICIDACPTKAIISPGVIDANKCISYHTIENKGKIPKDISEKIKKSGYIYGCDICQNVCPHNQSIAENNDKDLRHCIAGEELNPNEILSLKTQEDFIDKFKGSPIKRAGLIALKRNSKIFISNNKKEI